MMGFSLAILTMLWLLQVVFINVFYEGMKIQGIRSAAQRISAYYAQVQGTALTAKVQSITTKSDIYARITDTDGQWLYESNPENRDYRSAVENLDRPPWAQGQQADGQGDQHSRPQQQTDAQDPAMGSTGIGMTPRGTDIFRQFAALVGQSDTGEMMSPYNNRKMLLYGKVIADASGNKAVLIISSPLMPLDDTVHILQTQLVYISLVVLVLAIGISVLIAVHVSRPLTRITAKAALLARGRYDMTFDRGGYTEVDQLADTLNYTTKELGQVENLRRELIANVSHDLRTPLTMIKLYAEMIRDLNGNHPAKRNQNVGVIIEESDRLSALVQNLLDLSKLQSGALPFHTEAFDLVALANRILPRYDALVQQQGYHFTFEHPAELWVQADEARVEQVLYNLINNAVNYAGEDKMVALKAVGYERTALLSVSDNGEGIDEENLKRIWDRYYKVDKEHRRAVSGSGLGLSIVKSILDQHKAQYGVRSRKGEGATFWFELPLDMGSDHPAAGEGET